MLARQTAPVEFLLTLIFSMYHYPFCSQNCVDNDASMVLTMSLQKRTCNELYVSTHLYHMSVDMQLSLQASSLTVAEQDSAPDASLVTAEKFS